MSLYVRLTRFQHIYNYLLFQYVRAWDWDCNITGWLYQYPTQTMKHDEFVLLWSNVITSKHKSCFEVLSFGWFNAFERSKRSVYMNFRPAAPPLRPSHAKYISIFSNKRYIASVWQSDLSWADVIYFYVLPIEVEHFPGDWCVLWVELVFCLVNNVFFSNSFFVALYKIWLWTLSLLKKITLNSWVVYTHEEI